MAGGLIQVRSSLMTFQGIDPKVTFLFSLGLI